jgi:hypothetical protein
MKVTKSIQKEIEKSIEQKAKVGMVLTLGTKVLNCTGTQESSYGTRYMFQNGLAFTKSNILSNIIKCKSVDEDWSLM